jgi:hypothetical protein
MFKSKTLYNLEIVPNFHSSVTQKNQAKTLKQLDEIGLLGYKHVNEKGRVLVGLDEECGARYEGRFDLGGKSSTIIKSQEVNLASGSQSPEVYLDKGINALRGLGGRVDFWKEQETGRWYDRGVMINRLQNLAWFPGFFQRFRKGDRGDILLDFLQNPDNIKRVTW